MIDALLEMHDRIAELERRMRWLVQPGRIASVDKDAATVRVTLPSGLTIGPYPWGALSTSAFVAPASGDQCMLFCPNGNTGHGVALPFASVGDGKGDKHIIGDGVTQPVALAPAVAQELQLIAAALTAVSSGGSALTGANPYTAPGDVAAAKTEVE